MNIIEFKTTNRKSNIVFCFVDRTSSISSGWAKEITKNISEFVISNVFHKGYDLYQGLDEDELLNHVSRLNYSHAVVFSTGTEFINGLSFFDNVEKLIKKEFFICGHVLDRKDAYYELHHQCYIINLNLYKKLDNPQVGNQILGLLHDEIEPTRSKENYHDDYTPLEVSRGNNCKTYNHTCHGWNILRLGFENNFPILIFDSNFRNSKKHYYPESDNDFQKLSHWIYYREKYCLTEMIHTHNTEVSNQILDVVNTIITPASGTSWFNWLDTKQDSKVIYYDYNLNALDHWKHAAPRHQNINYEFAHIDLLGDTTTFLDLIKKESVSNNKLMINLSNIFCYEGTAALTPLSNRLYKENQIINEIKNINPDAYINFASRASTGFVQSIFEGKAKDFEIVLLSSLKKPSWRFNQEWL
jgi:hypothetical protein